MPDPTMFVLASASPRRRQLFGLGNWTYKTATADTDESLHADESAENYVLRLAKEKARTVAVTASAEQIVVGADTAVIDGTQILGKPKDQHDAERMLKQLRGRTHQVYTALALYRSLDNQMLTEVCITDVPMRRYSDEEMTAYVRSGDPMDKAGAYAIQDPHFHPVESMHGCYASVMGLPLCHLLRALEKLDVRPQADVPRACQELLNYDCPVSAAILRGEAVG